MKQRITICLSAFLFLEIIFLPITASSQSLQVYPPKVSLHSSRDRCQLVVSEISSGAYVDQTHAAKYVSQNPKVAGVDEFGVLHPKSDGSTSVRIRVGSRFASVSVKVTDSRKPLPIQFVNHIESIFSKQGCNTGPCHGAAAGKGGLRLSLRAYDPESDYVRLRLEGLGRRINKTTPANSLLVQKPSLAIPHIGGLKLRSDSQEYALISNWIANGAIGPRHTDPRITGLHVYPEDRTLKSGSEQQLNVTAEFSDGHAEDVTNWARYSSNDEPIAAVGEDGRISMKKPGETAITVWYLGKVAFSRVRTKFSTASKSSISNSQVKSELDRAITAKLDQLGIEASVKCSDHEFLRRAFLDTIGTLPSVTELEKFIADQSPKKRGRLIDGLLQRPEYVDFWTYRWADMLRVNRDLIGTKGMERLYGWLRQSVVDNVGWDVMARELIIGQGSSAQSGPANFYRLGSKPEEFAETVSQTFLGIRVQCAHCHNHPFEKWTQSDYYRMANFFARVERKESDGIEHVRSAATGEVLHPRLKRALSPAAFDGPEMPLSAPGDRREFLASWVIAPDNPYFARNMVNRIWKSLMGRGIVEPVDDMRLTNPPSNEPLLKLLTKRFVKSGFDAKKLVFDILTTDAYSRSAVVRAPTINDDRYFSKYLPRRMPAEVLLDAVCLVTGTTEKFGGSPAGTRAISLHDTHTKNMFLDTFGRPARQVTCECERSVEPNLGQALHFINSAGINDKIVNTKGNLKRLIADGKSDLEILKWFYQSSLSRSPSLAETKSFMSMMTDELAKDKSNSKTESDTRLNVLADQIWALLSSSEFIFSH